MEVFPKAKVVLTIRDPENWYKSVKETIYQGNLDRQMFPVNIYSWVNGSSKQLNMMETFTHASNNRFNNGKQRIGILEKILVWYGYLTALFTISKILE